MRRSTPRKGRNRSNKSGGGPSAIPVSDYESDAVEQHAIAVADASLVGLTVTAPALMPRDNDDLNWRVLRRYLPHMRGILAIAANVVVYNFATGNEQNTWEKSGSEGTMFVVELEPLVIVDGQQKQHVIPQNCIYILNRKSMVNFHIDLRDATECEDLGELIVVRVQDKETASEEADGAERKVIGLWIHPDKVKTRENNTSIILAAWKQTRDATRQYLEAAASAPTQIGLPALVTDTPQPIAAIATQASQSSGRRLSITELFGQRGGLG